MVALVNRKSPVQVLGQSAVAASHTGNTNETTVATINIPAGSAGANGRIEVKAEFTFPSSANIKTLRIKLGATTLWSGTPTTATHFDVSLSIANRNSASSQRWRALHSSSGNTVGDTSGTASVDTSASVDITITVQLASGAETVTLESYQAILYPKA